MKFDVVLVGGGLSSLVCGIKLQNAGRKCLMVSSGQNSLHFSSGAFGLLGRLPDGTAVTEPFVAMASLDEEHPYSKIGISKVAEYSRAVPGFFSGCGVRLNGLDGKNGWRMTASGSMRPAWLSMREIDLFGSKDAITAGKAMIVNFAGFLDFNTAFIADSLKKNGVECRIETVRMEAVEILRQNPSEMRSVNISRVMDREENWKEFCRIVQEMLKGEELVILPDVFGLKDEVVTDWIREKVPADVLFVGTMPPSVPGIRVQNQLKKAFEKAGGTFLMGDEVMHPEIKDRKVLSVRTANLGEIRISADHFVLASGNLFGKGLESSLSEVHEPVFGLDVDYPSCRNDWYNVKYFGKQNFTGFGVRTDKCFRPYKSGELIENLYVVGAELGGHNPLYEGSGAGVAIMSALCVADEIVSEESTMQ